MSPSLDDQTKAQRCLDRALEALDAQLPERAAEHVEQCLRIDPDNLSARVAQARAALAANRPAQALSALDSAGLYDPEGCDAPEVAMLRAVTLARCGMDHMARPELDKLAEQFPDDVRPRRMLAELCARAGMLDEAVEHVRNVVRLAPTDAAARRTLAQMLQDRDPETSIDILLQDKATASSPVTQLLAARLHRKAGGLRDAQEIYDQLLADRPDDPTVWLEAGELADATGSDALAKARLQRAVELATHGKAAALAALALAHMHSGRFLVAGRCWWRMAQRCQDSVQAWAGLLVCSIACGKSTLADRVRRILDLHWSKAEHRAAVAAVWPDAACGIVVRQSTGAEAPKADADSPLNDLLESAVDALARHAEERPNRADTHYHLAMCSDALGRKETAGRAVRTALQVSPAYVAANDLAERLHAA